MDDPLDALWPLLDLVNPIVSAWEIESSQDGAYQRLLDASFLRRTDNAEYVLCPECRQHREEVLASDRQGKVCLYIPCPVTMRAEVPLNWVRQWTVDYGALTSTLSSTFALSGHCKELVPGRLWRLGRTDWRGQSRDVMLARGLHWQDATGVRAELVRGSKPIVFVGQQLPPENFWRRSKPPVIPLSDYSSLCDNQIEIEVLAVATAISEAGGAAPMDAPLTITEEQLRLRIRRLIKSENKTVLTDDVMVAAYRHCHSMRSAAAHLTSQLGREVSKDQVFRAVQKAGGVLALSDGQDSDSVIRDSSQFRDKNGKVIPQSQSKKDK